jgi:nucleotide-binding universal stress UspA family protein
MLKVERVLVPVDFSEGSDAALEYALGLTHALGGHVDVLHVLESPRYSSDLMVGMAGTTFSSFEDYARGAATREMESFLARHRSPGPKVHARIDAGDPAHEIVRRAETDRYDLVVMATHGRSGLAHLLVGSVTEKVIRRAPCPVLTVRTRAVPAAAK